MRLFAASAAAAAPAAEAAIAASDVAGLQQGGLVVVESPAKARKIQQYLGDGFTVIASYGHVRDLAEKPGSVKPEAGFEMVWSTAGFASRQRGLADIVAAMKASRPQRLVLASDPDREGEAIAWHVLEELKAAGLLRGVAVQRITFVEVTKSAVLAALAAPRQLAAPLVDAYLARRALDYLLGFHLTPVLWRKLPAARSAGRVQSVALRLVAERESEIQAFAPQHYWTVAASLEAPSGAAFQAQLTKLDNQKVGRQGFATEAEAAAAAERIASATLRVALLSSKEMQRNPSPPFTTSTLQQTASQRLGMGAAATMSGAQTLYEGGDGLGEGVITYMRTDGVQLSQEIIDGARAFVRQQFGNEYLPASPRIYKSKAKNAQEAHEAVRPTDAQRRADALQVTEARLRRLYDLIWRRTLASQMAAARIQQVGVDVESEVGDIQLRATGSTVAFPGFLAVWGGDDGGGDGNGSEDDAGAAEGDASSRVNGGRDGGGGSTAATAAVINSLKEGEALTVVDAAAQAHATAPPPRFTEGSLVKALEERGIGRPSTYAPTLQLLQARGYVSKQGKALKAEPLGRVLMAFLTIYFPRYVDYGFTAGMEAQLDDVSAGQAEWRRVLAEFWNPFDQTVQSAMGISVTEVIDELDAVLEPMLFPAPQSAPDSGSGNGSAAMAPGEEAGSAADAVARRKCPSCGGHLGLKLSRKGAFVGCSGYPDCSYSRPLDAALGEDGAGGASELFAAGGDQLLGRDPETGRDVRLRMGPYGPYLQLQAAVDGGEKARNVALPPSAATSGVTLQEALVYLRGQRIALHPDDGQPIMLETGKYGPYLKHGSTYASLPKAVAPEELDLQVAVDLLAKKAARNAAKAAKTASSGAAPAESDSSSAAASTKSANPKTTKSAAAAGTQAKKATVGKAAPRNPKAPSGRQAAGGAADSSAGGKPGRRRKADSGSTAADPSIKPPGSTGRPSRAKKADPAAAAAAGSSTAKRPAARSAVRSPGGRAGGVAAAGSSRGASASRPPPPWQAFRKARWDAVQAQHGDLTGKELFAAVARALGQQWRALSPEEQAAYGAGTAEGDETSFI